MAKTKTKTKKKKGKAKQRRSWWRRALLFLAILTAVIVLGGGGAAGGMVWYYSRDLPSLDELRQGPEGYRARTPQTTRIVTSDGELVGELFNERRTVVEFEQIPERLVHAVLAAEDADFYQHEGLDYPGIVRAMFTNLRQGRMAQGASTITQQVVGAFLPEIDRRERTFERKIREALLARRLEQYLSKEEILFLYLNQINFGHARYGVQEASRFYFDRDVEDITLAQAALLAGTPRGPSIYSPFRNPDRALARRNWVLGQMEAKGFATAAEVAEARAAPLGVVPREPEEELAPEIISRVRSQLVDLVGAEQARRGGYLIKTTIDADLQRAARSALREGLEAVDERHNYRGPLQQTRGRRHRGEVREGRTYLGEVVGADDRAGTVQIKVGAVIGEVGLGDEERYNPRKLRPSRFARKGALVRVSVLRLSDDDQPAHLRLEVGPQGALVAIEPGTGRIRALIGGYDQRPGDFDRATQARRQPGSAFKPFVYSLALNSRRVTPATLIADAPEVLDQWQPSNYEEWRYEGHVRLRQALAKSINMVAVKLIRDLGPEEVASYAERLGIESPLEPTPTLALGASAVAPVEMAEAYAVFASGGIHAEPYLIEEIRRPDGEVIRPSRPEPVRVMEPAQAYLISSMLRSVVREGTARGAREVGSDAAGKTGTSNEARDAWFVGFADDLTCAVWVGFDYPRTLGRRESGSRAALPIWVRFMGAALGDRRAPAIERPEGIETVLIDPETGLLAYEGQENALEEEFLEGTAPTEQAIPPEMADPDTFLMEQTGGEGADAGPEVP